jgi:hypothetical protein
MKIAIEHSTPKTTFFQAKPGDVFSLSDRPNNLLVKISQIRTSVALYNAFDLHTSEVIGIEDWATIVIFDDVKLTVKK